MNTAPESIHQLEQQSYDYGYACGLAKHGEICAIIEDMAHLLHFCSANLPASHGSDSFKRTEDAFKRYLAITTKSA